MAKVEKQIRKLYSGASNFNPKEVENMIPGKPLTDEEVIELRKDKVELNRKFRRQTGMKAACSGKVQGLLECQTPEGRCPEYEVCHTDKK